MARKPKRKKSTSAENDPVKPGTPLHDMLKLIARQMAKELEGNAPAAEVASGAVDARRPMSFVKDARRIKEANHQANVTRQERRRKEIPL